MRAQLIPVQGGSPVEIVKDLTLVGRKEDCDLRLDHKSVSKLHCVIVKTDGLLLLRDLGSTNGTRVNGQRVRRAALLPNDQLTIASYAYRVIIGPAAAAPEPPPSPEERTQHIDAQELSKAMQAANGPAPLLDSQADAVIVPVQNALPDVYPEDDKKK
ncbi:MAG: FHA domain-containing protein [Planctomycetes bacterium]|nr:FHA domain-containing protein [Planctomycetota bacterium]